MPKTKRYTLDDIINQYEKRRQNSIQAVLDQIYALFDTAASKAARAAARRRLVNNRFLPRDVRESIDAIFETLNSDIEKRIVNGIRKAWNLSNEKNDLIVDTQASGSGRKPPKAPASLVADAGFTGGNEFYGRNLAALEAFITRKDAGLGLSSRIFKLSNVYKKAINDILIEGLREGTSARELAKQLRYALRHNYEVSNPGQGMYSMPRKNAERLARNEINLAYANADYERWNQQWFIIGIEVRLSNRHPIYDMCDNLKGRYPKDFHFTGWHVNCLCIAIPIMAPQEALDAMMDYQLGLIDKLPRVDYIKEMPKGAQQWTSDNAKRIEGWKSQPYWIANNEKFVSALMK